ncbi:glutamate receptor-like [Ornithodoros turicata]|uniref:glutamate receptor-like n=1 Tax=Ornithodoros turicata TaxID=34597 RepID=UPI003138B3E0
MTGPMPNIISILAELMGFRYSVTSPEDLQWGMALPNGSWTGMVGMLFRNSADLALGPIAMTYDRSQVSRFTAQVTTDYLTILTGFPEVVEANIFGTIMAFEWKVWLGLLISILVCVATNLYVDCVMDPAYAKADLAKLRLEQHWWTYFSAMFCESSVETPVWISGRIVFAIWWLAVVVMMNAFTGHMKATMMVRPEPFHIESMRDLADTPNMRTLVWKGTAYEALLKNSLDVEEYQKVWLMVQRSNGTIETNSLYSQENLKEVQLGRTVIVSDVTTMRYHVSRTCRWLRHGNYHFAQEQFFPHKFAMAVRKDIDLKFIKELNSRISWLKEAGLIDAWLNEQYGDWKACSSARHDDVYSALSLFEVQSIFLLYGLFSAISLFVFLLESIAGKCTRRKRAH